MSERKLIAVDGNSLMYRAFHALPPMTARDGTPTGALHGFLIMLLKLVDMKPTHLVVAFDVKGPTFRHEVYNEYKAGRKPMPDELLAQFPLIKELLGLMRITVCECPGFEADDIIGTLGRRANEQGMPALLVTGDRDALQLVDDDTHVLVTKKGISESIEFDPAAIEAQYGLPPALMPDLKGLMGDASDNLPGVPGVGEKTAVKLLKKYGSIDAVLNNWENETGALREKLHNGSDSAKMSYKLGIIDTDAPIGISVADCEFSPNMMANVGSRLAELELRVVLAKLPAGAVPVSPKPTPEVSYRQVTVRDREGLADMAAKLRDAEYIALEIGEGMTAAVPGDIQYRVVMEPTLLDPGLDAAGVISAMRPILSAERPKKLCYDAKGLMTLLAKYDTELSGVVFDAMLVDYLLDPLRNSKTLKELAERRVGRPGDAAALADMFPAMMEELAVHGAGALYRDIELPLAAVLFDMERAGVAVDAGILAQLGQAFEARIRDAENRVYEIADEKFNILSTKQLGVVLFDKLGLPPQKKTKTGYSTDSEVLENLAEAHEIVPYILEYRMMSKLKSTFIDGMLPLRDKNGRIHTSFNQTITATGRLSSTEPNLQNIPVRTGDGREIRKAFVAPEGRMLIGADYSQIELRLLAHMSGDERLIGAFIDELDIHTRTASEVFGVPIDMVTREQRSAAKAVNFGIVYGISDYGLAKQLGISRKRASEYIENYFLRYPAVKIFLDGCIASGREKGYAETMMGRRRALPELQSSNYNLRSFGERVAMNMPIQGTAADIIKLAMVRASNALREAAINARLVLQVHDELIIEASEADVARAAGILRDSMENAVTLRVPLAVDVHTGHSWFDTK